MHRKIILSILSLLVFIILIEIVIRVIKLSPNLTKQHLFLETDKHLPFKPKPNSEYHFRSLSNEFDVSISINSMSLRDIEHPINKPANTYRILGLGDSFTMGFGADFEQTYLYKLEKMLNARYLENPNIEIIKAGIGRYYTELERLLLEHYGQQYDPDLIILGFVPNDIHDTFMGKESVTVRADGYLLTREANEIGYIGSWLYLNSHCMRLVLSGYIKYIINKKYNFQWSEVYKENGLYEKQWQEVEQELLKIKSISSNINSKLLLLHIPHLGPFYEDSKWELSYPGTRLADFSNKNGIRFLDLYPALYSESRMETLYWPVDNHPNSKGYQLIANQLFNYISKHNLINGSR